MGIRRLGIANPAAESDTTIFTATEPYLASVVATNKSASATADISVWVEPFGATLENEYAYIIYNLPVDQLNSYETFRFAVNTGDQIHVESSTADVSFQAYGLVQYDVKLGAGISSYSASAPSNPIAGMIWVDSDEEIGESGAKPIYIYDGSDWVPSVSSGIDTSANYTFTGTVVIPGYEKEIPLQNSAPSSPSSSDLWIDSSGSTPILRVYNGTSWIALASPADDDQNILANRVFG